MANLPGSFLDGINTDLMKQQFLESLRLQHGSRFDAIVKEFNEARTMENKMKATAKYNKLCGADKSFEQDFRKVKDKVSFKDKLESAKLRNLGNVMYQKGENKMAHELYTKSIAYAPLNYIELALAYANRSAVLRTMQKCRECLMDIERALSYGYPREKSFKLLLREMQCHRDLANITEANESSKKASKLVDSLSGLTAEQKADMKLQLMEEMQVLINPCSEEVTFPTEVPALSYGPNPEVVGASSAVRIEYNEQQGRHLVATRDINIGDVLMIAENQVICVIDEFKYNHCTHCQKLCYHLIPCSRCVWMMFCSEKCQKEANQKYHDAECAPYSRFRYMNSVSIIGVEQLFDRVFRLFARIGVKNLKPYLKYARRNIYVDSGTNEEKRTRGFDANGKFDPANLDVIFNLSTKIKEVQTDILIGSLKTLQTAQCLGMSLNDPDFYAVAGLYLQLQDIAFMNCYSKSYINYSSEPKIYTKVAVCFNPLRSLLNHSCVVANTMHVEYGNSHVVMAKWPIAKGSVLTESYVQIATEWSKAWRQKFVKQECSFICKCVPCEENWDFREKSRISDPDDQKLATKIVSYNENILVDLYRTFSHTPIFSKLPHFDTFLKERLDFLTKMWNKGEYLDRRCFAMQYQLEVYYFLLGNRLICPDNYSDQVLQDPQLVKNIVSSIEEKYSKR